LTSWDSVSKAQQWYACAYLVPLLYISVQLLKPGQPGCVLIIAAILLLLQPKKFSLLAVLLLLWHAPSACLLCCSPWSNGSLRLARQQADEIIALIFIGLFGVAFQLLVGYQHFIDPGFVQNLAMQSISDFGALAGLHL